MRVKLSVRSFLKAGGKCDGWNLLGLDLVIPTEQAGVFGGKSLTVMATLTYSFKFGFTEFH
jgi:hypothetical protein